MRLITLLAASLLVSASALPALALDAAEAQATYDNSELSDEADIALWCGAAFQNVAAQATEKSMTDEATAYTAKANLLFERASVLMTDEGLDEAGMTSIGQAYGYAVAVQMSGEPDAADHSEEECEAEAAKP